MSHIQLPANVKLVVRYWDTKEDCEKIKQITLEELIVDPSQIRHSDIVLHFLSQARHSLGLTPISFESFDSSYIV